MITVTRIGLTAVVIFVAAGLGRAQNDGDNAPTPPQPPTVQVTAVLVDGSRIIGAPSTLKALPFKADFGAVSIPLHLIDFAEFTKDRASVKIKFRNGDLLTGVLELDRVVVRTSFGEATIPIARVVKMTFRTLSK